MDMRNMTPEEKKLAQAQHRLEAQQARNRNKEYRARTRRLIQRGAMLEKAFPASMQMENEELQTYLCRIFQNKN